jgi:hypothetical protein
MFDAGFGAVVKHGGRSGSNAAYAWEVTTWYEWEPAEERATVHARALCMNRFTRAEVATPDELRATYDRWVLEHACLVSLGLDPDAPPPFEEFQATWQTGPWMPIDGISYRELMGEPKLRCGLEMLE